MKFSANLGLLWNDLSLPDAIRAAKAAGFDAVECDWPYDIPDEFVKAALDETGLTMLGLNTRRGNVEAGDNGLSAIPGREEEAHAGIDEAFAYAVAIGTPNIRVMAGFSSGDEAHRTFVANLRYACEKAAPNLKLMFDCYQVQLMEGDLTHRIEALLPWIGHIQFASVPGRGAPDYGEINYDHVFRAISGLGYTAP